MIAKSNQETYLCFDAEFTFWPLGAVLSFGEELGDPRLAPIHHWTEYDYGYQGTVDLQLTVNPVATSYPLDFRNRDQVHQEAGEAVPSSLVSRSALEDLAKRMTERSGETDKGIPQIAVGHCVFCAFFHLGPRAFQRKGMHGRGTILIFEFR